VQGARRQTTAGAGEAEPRETAVCACAAPRGSAPKPKKADAERRSHRDSEKKTQVQPDKDGAVYVLLSEPVTKNRIQETMSDTTQTPTEPTRSNGHDTGAANQQPEQDSTDQQMVYGLKTAIDQRGRYSYRLNDMALGFAAGKQTSTLAARAEIEDRFTQSIGRSPQEYLNEHYRQLKDTRDNHRSSGRSR
jgi:hypothetical protein